MEFMFHALNSPDPRVQKRAEAEFLAMGEEAMGPLEAASEILEGEAGKRCSAIHARLEARLRK